MLHLDRTFRALSFAMVLIFTTACTGNEAAEAREEAKDLWGEYGPDDYRFMWRTRAMVGETRLVVEVRDDTVVSVDAVEERWTMMDGQSLTVENIFAELEQVQQDADAVDVVYDPELGYPRSVFVDVTEEAIDDEYEFHIEELEPL